ncbi:MULTISPECIES: SAV_2336 N-terminal domain-related protein [unclassified Streptomyces]|uniref:SAV_2336 N-terminal domain-related protein n=1 Tax=unclassified Streptomyces TaxID=2593676 RepID=UPI002E2CBA52|nr:SAV_2336 N-terminal domain-related protein [Streptomyces sp. NBC_00228]
MTAPPPPPAAEGPLGALTERLRARLGVEPGARELAEALWLAEHVAPAEVTLVEGDLAPDPLDGPTPFPTPQEGTPRPDLTTPTPAPAPADDRTHLYADRPRPVPREGAEHPTPEPDFTPVRIPVATALPNSLALQRALRPLQRYHPPVRTTAHRLDEQATAEGAAETGLFTPVLRSGVRRESRMRLLMDASTSTSLWDSTLEELRQICAGLGAFREVQVHYVHQGADGQLAIGTSREPGRGLRAAEQVRDPTGRQLTLVLSDCAGPLWRSGQLQRLLHHWAQAAPVAVVQPLPQRLWRRTHLPALPGTLRRREGLGARLEFRPAEGHVPSGALPVPVLGPTRAALGTWARLLSGGTGLSLPAAAAWVHAAHPAAPPRRERPPADAGPLVTAFRRSASRQAVSLAVAFSAVPLSLPVMQLVQRAVQPQSGPSVLAEVLLSGLLRRGDGEGWYEFVPGVREELLRLLPRGDALLVLKHCGAYVERHFGRGARNFPALALARLTGDGGALPAGEEGVPEAFAEVSRVVLGRFEAPVRAVAEVPSESYAVVYRLVDQAWARWVGRVLGAMGHQVVLRVWFGAEQLQEALVMSAAQARTLLLVGDDYEPYETPLEDILARRDPRVVTVDVGTGRPALAFQVVDQGPDLSLSRASEGLARWRLLERLGADAPGDYPADIADTEFPGPARLVRGKAPERSPGYVLREDLLGQLRAKLAQARGSSAACALVGPPSSGKSALAAAYVRRFGADYDFVWWIRAGEHTTRLGDVRRYGSELAPSTDGLPLMQEIHETFRRLREAKLRWLIVYDGWDDLQDANDLLISGGHALITSQDGAWAEVADALRVSAAEESPAGPAAQWDELVRRALVRVHAPAGAQGVVSASGFFLAPGWVVTAAHVVEDRGRLSGVGITTMDGRRRQVEQVRDVGDLALLHVPDVAGVDCLWLGDHPAGSEAAAMLYGADGPLDAPRVVTTTSAVSGRSRDTLRLDGELIPVGSAGGPVIDEHRGAVIGVIRSRRPDGGGRGEAVPIEALRALCEQGITDTELWHGLVRAHDRHHAERFAERGPHLTWTGVQLGLTGTPAPALPPDERTELYGRLAELEPPLEPKTVLELLPPRQRPEVPPRHWRDGAGYLNQLATDEHLLLYTARAWAHLATRTGPAQAPAVAALRSWTDAARQRLRGPGGRDVGAAFSRVDTDFTHIGPIVRVEIERAAVEAAVYAWRLVLVRGSDESVLAQDRTSTRLDDLPERLRRQVGDALRQAESPGAKASVQFSLPRELLWELPVENWRLPDLNPLGLERHVFVRSQYDQDRSLRDRRRRWDKVSRGPLTGLRLDGASPVDWTGTPADAVPLLCRHDATSPTTGLDLAESQGFPLILWSRRATHSDEADCSAFYQRAERLLRHAGTARELVAQVGYLRAGSTTRRTSENAWARDLAIFCDPPDDR